VGSILDNLAPQASGLIIGSKTLLAPPAAVTISDTVFSVLPDGSSILIGDTKTMAIDSFLASQSGNVAYLYGRKTLRAGGAAITVDGVQMSLMSGGSSVVIGTRTEGASVLAGGSSSHRMEATSSGQGTESGGALQQKETKTHASRTTTSTGATLRQQGDCWIRIVVMLVGVWIIGVGLVQLADEINLGVRR